MTDVREMAAEDVAAALEQIARQWDEIDPSRGGNHEHQQAAAIRDIIAERDDLQRTFDMIWAAQRRAIKEWQAQHDEPLTWPDHAKLVTWLLEERDALRKALHCISLGSQNSGTSKEALGREARAALDRKP